MQDESRLVGRRWLRFTVCLILFIVYFTHSVYWHRLDDWLFELRISNSYTDGKSVMTGGKPPQLSYSKLL